jgi:hypothetical protein
MFESSRARVGRALAGYLSRPIRRTRHPSTSPLELVAATLRKGDVLLVDGNSRFSAAIRYLTQSTWSHSALCIDDAIDPVTGANARVLLEADVVKGVCTVPLSKYTGFHTRICRPVGLTDAEIDAVVGFTRERLGNQYDLKNVIDLVRYLVRTPPVPDRYKRRLMTLGSGDPTRAICSTLIAQAFQSVHYPILPIVLGDPDDPGHQQYRKELLRAQHYSLFAPRDFDVSPYFRIVKPTIEQGFDPHRVAWAMLEPEVWVDEGASG